MWQTGRICLKDIDSNFFFCRVWAEKCSKMCIQLRENLLTVTRAWGFPTYNPQFLLKTLGIFLPSVGIEESIFKKWVSHRLGDLQMPIFIKKLLAAVYK